MDYQISALMEKALPVTRLGNQKGPLTTPRTWGVYKLRVAARMRGRIYRFGNHPVRQLELTSEYGNAELIALFDTRRYAVELAHLLNTSQ